MTAGRQNHSSLSQHWCTPHKYVRALTEFFEGRPELDPCSNQHSLVRARVEYLPEREDGLHERWNFRTIYVNPPYGADRQRRTTIKNWLRKCTEAHREFGSEVLALVPVATNTRHWKLYVWSAATAVAFLYDTRLRFLVAGHDAGKGAPMSCAMVYWGAKWDRFYEVFLPFGAVVDLRPLQGKKIGLDEAIPGGA
jgi:hypothetical protein